MIKTVHLIAHLAVRVDVPNDQPTDDIANDVAKVTVRDAIADGRIDSVMSLDDEASVEFLGFGDGIEIGIVLEGGLVDEVRSNVPIAEYRLADLDVFEDCAGGQDGECSAAEAADGRKDEHNRIRAAHASIQTLAEVTA